MPNEVMEEAKIVEELSAKCDYETGLCACDGRKECKAPVANVFMEQPTTTVTLIKSSCVAATVDGIIVAMADDLDLGYVFALIYAVCQYRELKLADADIRFFRANGNPSQAASLEEAVEMWQEDFALLDFFNNADIPEMMDINDVFQTFEKFSEELKKYSLQELFPHGSFSEPEFTTSVEEDMSVRAS
jgi:hypothetical protein